LVEAVFFTARVSVALNGRDNLYKYFSTRRCSRLSAPLRADFRAFVDDVVGVDDAEEALTRFRMQR
jgi:hypothetical protein